MKIRYWMLLFLATCGILLQPGCKTCPPRQIVKVPVEVKVPVPVPPEPLLLPDPPQYETCTGTSTEILACVARNVVKLRDYSERLQAEIEAHNAAAEAPHD